MKWRNEETIAAISTPLGVGGVAMVRISGTTAVHIAEGLFRPTGKTGLAQAQSHRMIHGWVVSDDQPLDEVLAVWMKAPHSYTGEDVVEIHCHGGNLVARRILELALGGGAILAQAGEFTLRAFLNGRMDLTRVEAVGDIIHSTSDLGLKVSAGQLRGRLYGAIRDMTDRVAHVAALVTAAIDFPEEEVVEAHRTDFLARLTTVKQDLSSLAATAQKGRILTEGLAVAIVGRPNVGKSSLLNTLLRENRAIVTETAGTTRDTLEEVVQMGGMALRLIDTAGIRETGDQVEQLGISRSIQAMERADLVLWMVDGAEGITDEDLRLAATVPPDKTMVVVNKLDRMMGGALNLPPPLDLTPLAPLAQVVLSAKEGLGIHRLEQAIQDWAVGDTRPLLEHPLVTNTRQKQAAETALAALEEAVAGVQAGRGEELLALDLNRVLESLGEIVGETTPDDLLNRVFEQFCIGK